MSNEPNAVNMPEEVGNTQVEMLAQNGNLITAQVSFDIKKGEVDFNNITVKDVAFKGVNVSGEDFFVTIVREFFKEFMTGFAKEAQSYVDLSIKEVNVADVFKSIKTDPTEGKLNINFQSMFNIDQETNVVTYVQQRLFLGTLLGEVIEVEEAQ